MVETPVMTFDQAQRLYENVAGWLLSSQSEKISATTVVYLVEKTLMFVAGGKVAAEFRNHCYGSDFVREVEAYRRERLRFIGQRRAEHLQAQGAEP